VPSDRDKDGIVDAEDACPDTPGVKTDDPKTNGCPPPPPDRDEDAPLRPFPTTRSTKPTQSAATENSA